MTAETEVRGQRAEVRGQRPIVSAGQPPAAIVHSRVAPGVPAQLPARALAGAPFAIVEFSHGAAQLCDERGHGCGLFVNKHLAAQTAAALGLVLAAPTERSAP